MNVDMSHLCYLVAAAEHRSFRRAASAINVTQPTLSKRIRELEDRLGVRLFERSTGGAQLTVLGEEILRSARRILAELDFMEKCAEAWRCGKAGRLEIGLYTSLSAGPLGDVVFSFADQHKSVDLNVTESDGALLMPMLDRGTVDIIVVIGEPARVGFANISLWSERIVAVLPKSHAFASREFLHWTDLKNERFILSRHDPGQEIQHILLRKLSSPGYQLAIRQTAARQDYILSAINANQGVGLICESSAGNAPSDVVFRELRDGNDPTRVSFSAYWRRDNENPALRKFIECLRRHPAMPPLTTIAGR